MDLLSFRGTDVSRRARTTSPDGAWHAPSAAGAARSSSAVCGQAQVAGCDAPHGGPRREPGCPRGLDASSGTVDDRPIVRESRRGRNAARWPPTRRIRRASATELAAATNVTVRSTRASAGASTQSAPPSPNPTRTAAISRCRRVPRPGRCAADETCMADTVGTLDHLGKASGTSGESRRCPEGRRRPSHRCQGAGPECVKAGRTRRGPGRTSAWMTFGPTAGHGSVVGWIPWKRSG